MKARAVHAWPARLPADDDHPYRTGAWRPQRTEWDADDLDVIEGAIPPALDGVYLRNTENPIHDAIGRYHPFDGDGMVHAITFAGGRASYRNRVVRTAGLAAVTLAERGVAPWSRTFPGGVSAHPKLDPATGELLVWSYGTTAPYLRYGVIDRHGALVHAADVPLPGPRLPHDLAFTERFVIWNDLPLFCDPTLLAQGIYRPRFHRDQPSRFGIMPRRGTGADVRWFEAAPTYVLHWINAYEDGDEVVLDGYFQEDPMPKPDPADGAYAGLKKMVDLAAMRARPYRWRFDLRTGATREGRIADGVAEFPTIDPRRAGRPYRYAWQMSAPIGWFLFDGVARLDVTTGATDHYQFPPQVYASEAPMVPRPGGTREDDGWLVTFVSDVAHDTSECQIFAADRPSAGPIARVRLPERICSGTHACWASAEELHA